MRGWIQMPSGIGHAPGRYSCVLVEPSWGQARVVLGITGDKRCFNLGGWRLWNYVPYTRRRRGWLWSHISELSDQSVPKPVFVWETDRFFFSPNLFFTYIREFHKCLIYFCFCGSTLVQEMRKLSDSNCTILSFA